MAGTPCQDVDAAVGDSCSIRVVVVARITPSASALLSSSLCTQVLNLMRVAVRSLDAHKCTTRSHQIELFPLILVDGCLFE